MKVRSVIVLFAITLGVLSPLSVHLTIAQGQTSIGTFDVCHAGAPALSISNDMPCVNQPLYHPILPSCVESAEILDPTLKPLISIFQKEHPPKI
ncbi:MAG TPA: hypothetical protein VEM40_11095 [Nitrospirota bacterium]|nr:hypothetical protein [Nitrospirota bacterium]